MYEDSAIGDLVKLMKVVALRLVLRWADTFTIISLSMKGAGSRLRKGKREPANTFESMSSRFLGPRKEEFKAKGGREKEGKHQRYRP